MNIRTSKRLPSAKQLAQILKNEFSNQYEYEEFGLCEHKSLIVRRSFLVGVQISIDKNEVTIDAIPPSAMASFVSTIMSIFANLFIVFAMLPYRQLEKDVARFLKSKYA